MGKYYFYTNPNELNASQDVHHAFGPVIGGDPQIEVGKDKYRITNLHTTAQEAPAVAICDGTICVVEDDSTGSTVTIVLKPHYQPSFDFAFIKYFLFKGIKRSSIINGAGVVLNDDIPFTERLDEGWDEGGGANPKSNAAQALGLAYTASFMHPIDGTPTTIFADDQPIDNLFYYPNDDFQLPVVRAGEYIGYFDQAKFGFEIVLERLGYEPEISLARTLENVISVDSFTRANPEPDDADYFMHWHEKEACINYIDPCAFFGSFCGSRVFYKTGPSTGSSDRTKCNTPQEIYDGILKYFENRHKIYIDIRNDFGYSLQYASNKAENLKINISGNTAGESEISQSASGWPILTLNNNNDVIGIGKTYPIEIKVRCQANSFIGINSINALTKRCVKIKDQITITFPMFNYTDPVEFRVPVNSTGQIISYFGTQFIFRETIVSSKPSLQRTSNYKGDNSLRVGVANFNIAKIAQAAVLLIFKNYRYLQFTDSQNFSVNLAAMCISEGKVTFFSLPKFGKNSGRKFHGRDYSNKFAAKEISIKDILTLGNRNLFNLDEIEISVDGDQQTLPILDTSVISQIDSSLFADPSQWIVSLTLEELLSLIPTGSDEFTFDLNTVSEIFSNSYREFKVSAFTYRLDGNKYSYSAHTNQIELIGGA